MSISNFIAVNYISYITNLASHLFSMKTFPKIVYEILKFPSRFSPIIIQAVHIIIYRDLL